MKISEVICVNLSYCSYDSEDCDNKDDDEFYPKVAKLEKYVINITHKIALVGINAQSIYTIKTLLVEGFGNKLE